MKTIEEESSHINMPKGIFKDFIGIWDNHIDENTCREFVKYYDLTIKNNYSFSPTVIPFYESVKSEMREDESLFINSFSNQYPTDITIHYWECLRQSVQEYLENYSIVIQGSLHSWLFKVHKVKEKEGYHLWHYENGKYDVRDRYLVFMTYLQAPSEGGETEFLFQSQRIDPVVGRTLIWPAGFTHKHRGNPPLKGEKIYMTGWLNIAPGSVKKHYRTE